MLLPKFSRRLAMGLSIGTFITLCIGAWLVARYISPAPPSVVQMTTGAIDGASHQFGLKYQEYMKANGVRLELLTSSGGVQNLERLNKDTPIGFVQGGLGVLSLDPQKSEEDTSLRSLGVIGYEPIWIFTHSVDLAKQFSSSLSNFKGRKIAIGGEGSGTRKVALELLQSFGIDGSNTTLGTEGGSAAAKLLIDKQVDAVILISAPQGAAVQSLLAQPGIEPVGLVQAEGLTRRFPYMSLVTLKAASVDPQRNLPVRDITLLATTANLVIQDDLHPALAYLLLEAARDIHKSASLLNKPAEFPHPRATDFPLANEAQRYYKEGRPFLQRYLPYWAANFVQRLILILVPLLAVAVPVFKAIPSLLLWRQKNRLFRKYEVLLKLERQLHEKQLSQDEILEATALLDKVEDDISGSKFSLEFSDRVYTLRQHVEYVRTKLVKEEKAATV